MQLCETQNRVWPDDGGGFSFPKLKKFGGATFSTFAIFNQLEVNIEGKFDTYVYWWE